MHQKLGRKPFKRPFRTTCIRQNPKRNDTFVRRFFNRASATGVRIPVFYCFQLFFCRPSLLHSVQVDAGRDRCSASGNQPFRLSRPPCHLLRWNNRSSLSFSGCPKWKTDGPYIFVPDLRAIKIDWAGVIAVQVDCRSRSNRSRLPTCACVE